jgi:hypothetical protein
MQLARERALTDPERRMRVHDVLHDVNELDRAAEGRGEEGAVSKRGARLLREVDRHQDLFKHVEPPSLFIPPGFTLTALPAPAAAETFALGLVPLRRPGVGQTPALIRAQGLCLPD